MASFHDIVLFPSEKRKGVIRCKQKLLFGHSVCTVIGLCLVEPFTWLNALLSTISKFLIFEQEILHFHFALAP